MRPGSTPKNQTHKHLRNAEGVRNGLLCLTACASLAYLAHCVFSQSAATVTLAADAAFVRHNINSARHAFRVRLGAVALAPRNSLRHSARPVGIAAMARQVGQHEPALFQCVAAVLAGRSKKEVVGTNACGRIAAMADQKAVSNRAVRQFPRNPMRAPRLSVHGRLAVAVVTQRSAPQPAAVGLLHMAPKLNPASHGAESTTVRF